MQVRASDPKYIQIIVQSSQLDEILIHLTIYFYVQFFFVYNLPSPNSHLSEQINFQSYQHQHKRHVKFHSDKHSIKKTTSNKAFL